jgi:two-component system, OmpR family, response regulator ArlR
MEKALILVVEQDQPIIDVTVKALSNAGFDVIKAFSAVEGIKKIRELNPDLVIASTDLPPVNGENARASICHASYLPVVVLGDKEGLVIALESGADAYIVKPATDREVVARVNSVLRRKKYSYALESGGTTGIDNLLDMGEASPDSFSPIEYRLHACLVSNEGRLLNYPQIIAEVWGHEKVQVDTLHFYMRRLRRKMLNSNIFSMRGVGYGINSGGRATP